MSCLQLEICRTQSSRLAAFNLGTSASRGEAAQAQGPLSVAGFAPTALRVLPTSSAFPGTWFSSSSRFTDVLGLVISIFHKTRSCCQFLHMCFRSLPPFPLLPKAGPDHVRHGTRGSLDTPVHRCPSAQSTVRGPRSCSPRALDQGPMPCLLPSPRLWFCPHLAHPPQPDPPQSPSRCIPFQLPSPSTHVLAGKPRAVVSTLAPSYLQHESPPSTTRGRCQVPMSVGAPIPPLPGQHTMWSRAEREPSAKEKCCLGWMVGVPGGHLTKPTSQLEQGKMQRQARS